MALYIADARRSGVCPSELTELDTEGGIAVRAARYRDNHRILVSGMREAGYRALIDRPHQSPIITAFLYPSDPKFRFRSFYDALKSHGFVIYPGKISDADTFRIGTIGHVFPDDIRQLVTAVQHLGEG